MCLVMISRSIKVLTSTMEKIMMRCNINEEEDDDDDGDVNDDDDVDGLG